MVLLLWSVVVVVVLLVALSGVASRFPRQFQRVPANSGPRADRIWSDLSGAAGSCSCCCWRWWWWRCCWRSRVLPASFLVNSSEFRQIPGPEPTGSGGICRGQRVGAVVVVGGGGGVVVGGVVGCCRPVSTSIPASSGQFRARSGLDLVGSVGGSGFVLSLLLVVVAVVLSVASSGVARRFPRQFLRVPADSGPGADRIWLDPSGAAGSCRCCCWWW